MLVAACEGQLDKVAALCEFDEPEYTEDAQTRLTATATNIMAASQIIALSAFDEIKKLAEKRKDLGKLKLPEATTITDEVRNRVKQLTTGNPPAQA